MKEKVVKEKKTKVRKKMSSKFKKVLVLSCFCGLLLITGAVNIVINNLASEQAAAEVSSTANFFSNYRTDRTDTRHCGSFQKQRIFISQFSDE